MVDLDYTVNVDIKDLEKVTDGMDALGVAYDALEDIAEGRVDNPEEYSRQTMIEVDEVIE